MKPDIHARHAVRADIDAMAQIYADAFDDLQPKLSVLQFLETPGAVALVAEIEFDGTMKLGGYLVGRVVMEQAEIFSVGVGSPVRRLGCGRRLVEIFCGHAALNGAEKVFLEVAVDNANALALYRKTGFKSVGRRKNYYADPDGKRVDALVMECALLRESVSKPESIK